jgi:hypothetical protein
VSLVCISFVALACARAQPPAATPVQATSHYLLPAPTSVVGEQKHLTSGVWCSEDDAFALPVIPFANGPTEIRDTYVGWGITTSVEMFDSDQSVVMVSRTMIRPDRDPSAVFQELVDGAMERDEATEEITAARVSQNGLTQLQEINRFPLYRGKESMATLDVLQGFAHGSRRESCRVDRHFVSTGYYFHIIAVAYEPAKPLVPCDFAVELASWTVDKLQIGRGCGPRMEPRH